jgi:type III pantothenate kinase
MVITIDIGNSDIVTGVWVDSICKWKFRMPSKGVAKEDYQQRVHSFNVENAIEVNDVKGIIIGSVVPDMTSIVVKLYEDIYRTTSILFNRQAFDQMQLKLVKPDEIGADLVANSVAAFAKYQQCCVVTDFGTALTFTTIDDQGEVLGVAIAPGLKTAMGALISNTAQLPDVALEYPKSVLGKDTIHAIRSGILVGYTGLVKHMLTSIRDELGKPCKFIATGGLSFALTPLNSVFDDYDGDLTLRGLKIAFEQLQ